MFEKKNNVNIPQLRIIMKNRKYYWYVWFEKWNEIIIKNRKKEDKYDGAFSLCMVEAYIVSKMEITLGL